MENNKTYKVITIAGSDPSGGAGIQADIKTITALGGYAASAITALTIQNTLGVKGIFPIPDTIVSEQINAIMEDIEPQTIKIGMVKDINIVRCIAKSIQKYKPQFAVYDPVMISTSGHKLIDDNVIEIIEQHLIPETSLITPNLKEAETLLKREIVTITDMEIAAKQLSLKYHIAVLIKGGHLEGNIMCDILAFPNGNTQHFTHEKIESKNLHGTGCTLSSAIATFVAQNIVETHESVSEKAIALAIQQAKEYVTKAILSGKHRDIGKGHGPLWHLN